MGRTRAEYSVDWDDPDFPRIYVCGPGGVPLAEAKAEVIQRFKDNIEHAQVMITKTRILKAGDIGKEEEWNFW